MTVYSTDIHLYGTCHLWLLVHRKVQEILSLNIFESLNICIHEALWWRLSKQDEVEKSTL